MNFELFLPYEQEGGIVNQEVRMAVDRSVKTGWDGVVLTVNVRSMKNVPPPPEPVQLSNEAEAIVNRRYSLFCLSDYAKFSQFTRLNLETDSIDEVHAFMRQMPALRYSMYSVTPLSEQVFKMACQTMDIDIISLDLPAYMPKKKWKDLKGAVNRGIAVEIRYSQFLKSSQMRQSLISAAKSLTFVLRRRNILLSNGCLDSDLIRSPSDVHNIAALLKIKHPELITNSIPKSVLAKGLSRSSYSGIARLMKDIPVSSDEEDVLPIVMKTD